MTLEQLLSQRCKKILEKYSSVVGKIIYQERGIFPSEGLAFCAAVDLFGATRIIESGVCHGMSTEILAKNFLISITGIDNDRYGAHVLDATAARLKHFAHVKLIRGDSFEEIPKLLRASTDRAAVLIDGPKGEQAMELAEKIFEFPSALFVAIHDMGKEGSDHLMRKWPHTFLFTDSRPFRETFGYLDSQLPNIAKYPLGPVLGFATNPHLSLAELLPGA